MAEGCGNKICEATDYDDFTITCLKQSLRALCKKGASPTKEFTSMEFYMFGAGMLFLGVLLGVVGIAVYKSQCLPDEVAELRDHRRELERQRQNQNLLSSEANQSEEEILKQDVTDHTEV